MFSLKNLYKNQVVNKRIEFVAIFLQTAYSTTEWGRLDRLSGCLKRFQAA
ncbi:MAG: hypothetical protein J6T41_03240 [Neisseriaceae bacterium]|nr:hypothetical protein [Neisseriaceae bacterium]